MATLMDGTWLCSHCGKKIPQGSAQWDDGEPFCSSRCASLGAPDDDSDDLEG